MREVTNMPKKRCLNGSCRELIDYSESYCNKHKKQLDQNYNKYKRNSDTVTTNGKTEKEIADFYNSPLWRRVRRQVMIRDNYVCQHCFRRGILHKANMVHHKIELRSPDGWRYRIDLNELEAINKTCHNEIEHQY